MSTDASFKSWRVTGGTSFQVQDPMMPDEVEIIERPAG
jgi:hypothetical protein